jgi:hypothetical protein
MDTCCDLSPSWLTSGKGKSASMPEEDTMNEHKIGSKWLQLQKHINQQKMMINVFKTICIMNGNWFSTVMMSIQSSTHF